MPNIISLTLIPMWKKNVLKGKMNVLKQVVWGNWSALCHGLPCLLQITLEPPQEEP